MERTRRVKYFPKKQQRRIVCRKVLNVQKISVNRFDCRTIRVHPSFNLLNARRPRSTGLKAKSFVSRGTHRKSFGFLLSLSLLSLLQLFKQQISPDAYCISARSPGIARRARSKVAKTQIKRFLVYQRR